MAHSSRPPNSLAAFGRSQSDSDLISQKPDQNGLRESLRRNTSMEDLSSATGGRTKNFLYRLVRPWKWRRRRNKGSKGQESPTSQGGSSDAPEMHFDPAPSQSFHHASDSSSTSSGGGGGASAAHDPNSVTYYNPLHRSSNSGLPPPPPQTMNNGMQQVASPPAHYPPLPQRFSQQQQQTQFGGRASSEPSYHQPRGGSSSSEVSTTSGPPQYPPPPKQQQQQQPAFDWPSSSSSSEGSGGGRGGKPPVPLPKPKDKKVVTIVTATNAPESPRSILKGGRQYADQREADVAKLRLSASPQHQQDGKGGRRKQNNAKYLVYSPDDDDSSSEDDMIDRGGEGGEEGSDDDKEPPEIVKFGNKVLRSDSIAILRERRKNEPVNTQSPQQRSDIESKLIRRLSQRPPKLELQQRNIIPEEKGLRDQQFEDRKTFLERKLSRRPTVKELREKRILIHFADYAEVVECEEYDRRADKPWTRLRPEDKAAIRKELNDFKRAEMSVHPESEYMTRFHKP